MLSRIDHVGIACRDLEAKIAFYESTFGLTVASIEVNEAQGVREAMLQVGTDRPGSSYVQLLEPLRPDTPVGRFLERRGEGVVPASSRCRRSAHRAGPACGPVSRP